MTCLCNPHAEPNAPQELNCPIHGELARELARCDREIERICQEMYAGSPDIEGMLIGLHDWRTEKKLIANESLPRTESPRLPEFKHGETHNG